MVKEGERVDFFFYKFIMGKGGLAKSSHFQNTRHS